MTMPLGTYGNLVENLTTSSLMPIGNFNVTIKDDDYFSDTEVFFIVELCHSQPLGTLCDTAKVIIENDDGKVKLCYYSSY